MLSEVDYSPPLRFLFLTTILIFCLGSGGEGEPGWEVVTLVLASLYSVFSQFSLPKSGQQKSCQPRGRFLELLPLSWKFQPAAEARRITINILNGWTTPASWCQTTASQGGVWMPQPDPRTPRWQAVLHHVNTLPPKSNSYVAVEFLDLIWPAGILAGFDCICTLITVFQNNTILNGKTLDITTEDQRALSHILLWSLHRAVECITASK